MSVPPAAPSAPAKGMRTFLVLWSTQTLSLFGTFVSQFAVNIWLTLAVYPAPAQKPQLALALTAVALASTAPLIAFMPLAGAFADRHDRRRIMIAANTVSFVLTSLLVALCTTGHLTVPIACVVLVGYSLTGAFHSAAFDSSYGALVPADQRGRANGMMQTSFALSQVMAPAIAATLIGLPALLGSHARVAPAAGVPFAFAADAVSFAIAAIAVVGLRIPAVERTNRGASLWHDVREGVHWIVRRKPFLALIRFGSLANLTFAPLMLLLPLLVRDRLAADRAAHHLSYEATLALVNSAMGAGGVVGGIAMSLWGGLKRQRVYGMIGGMVLLGAGQVLAGLAGTVTMLAVGLFLSELFVPALNAHSFVLWQELTPPEMLARALSTRRFIAQIAFPIGTAIAGALATRFEPWHIVVVSGALLALYCLQQILSPGFASLEARMRESAASPAP